MRDAATTVLAALLAVLALASAGVLGAVPLPTTPQGLAAAVVFLLAAWVGVVLPSLDGAGPVRVLETLLVAAPVAALARRTAPGDLVVPWTLLAGAFGLGLLACALRAPWRGRMAAAVACLLGATPVLAAADVWVVAPEALLPRDSLAVRAADAAGAEVDPEALVPAPWRTAREGVALRPGALARTPADPAWPDGRPPTAGARWIPVPSAAAGALPSAGRAVRVVGTGATPPRIDGAFLVGGPWRPVEALDLDPFDAVVLLGPAGDDAASGEALATYVRRGGLLVGPAPPEPWPDALRRRLGSVGAVEDTGVAAARPLGAGHVGRARAADEVAAFFAAGLDVPRVGTAFDRAISSPQAPWAFARWSDDPDARRWPATLVAAYVLVAAVVAAQRPGSRRLLALLGLGILGAAGASFVAPSPPSVSAEAFALETGGAGGRRVEGLFLAAGPAGWVGPREVASKFGLRTLGLEVRRFPDGLRLALPPGGEGWLVEESVATGGTGGLAEVETPPDWAVPLLRRGGPGASDLRLHSGVRAYRGPRPEGLALPDAARAVVVAPGRP